MNDSVRATAPGDIPDAEARQLLRGQFNAVPQIDVAEVRARLRAIAENATYDNGNFAWAITSLAEIVQSLLPQVRTLRQDAHAWDGPHIHGGDGKTLFRCVCGWNSGWGEIGDGHNAIDLHIARELYGYVPEAVDRVEVEETPLNPSDLPGYPVGRNAVTDERFKAIIDGLNGFAARPGYKTESNLEHALVWASEQPEVSVTYGPLDGEAAVDLHDGSGLRWNAPVKCWTVTVSDECDTVAEVSR